LLLRISISDEKSGHTLFKKRFVYLKIWCYLNFEHFVFFNILLDQSAMQTLVL